MYEEECLNTLTTTATYNDHSIFSENSNFSLQNSVNYPRIESPSFFAEMVNTNTLGDPLTNTHILEDKP